MTKKEIAFYVTTMLYPNGSTRFGISSNQSDHSFGISLPVLPVEGTVDYENNLINFQSCIREIFNSACIPVTEYPKYKVFYNKEYKSSGTVRRIQHDDMPAVYELRHSDEMPMEKEEILFFMKCFRNISKASL